MCMILTSDLAISSRDSWTLPKQISFKDDICPICLENDQKKLIEFSCNHTFHEDCIYLWQKNSNTCPLCRSHLTFHVSESIYLDQIIKFFGHVGCRLVSWPNPRTYPIVQHIQTNVKLCFPYIEIENPEFIYKTFVLERKSTKIFRKAEIYLKLLEKVDRNALKDPMKWVELFKDGNYAFFLKLNDSDDVDIEFLEECLK